MKKSLLIKSGSVVAILAVGFLGMTVLGSSEKHSNVRDMQPEVRTIDVKPVTFGNVVLEIEGNGTIESQQVLTTVAEASGIVQYARNNLKDGTSVKANELILSIDSREVENTLYTLRSSLMNSVAALLPEMKVENEAVYKKWLDYFNKLDVHRDVPELPAATDPQEKIRLSVRDVYSKYYAVKNQEILLSKHKIYAPFDGYISSNGIIENSFVTRGQQLFTLSDSRNLEIAVPLLIDDIKLIDFSGQVNVKIYPDKNGSFITGKIIRKETNLRKNSQTLNVYVSFSNTSLNPDFLPGNYVKVKIAGKEYKNVAVIPRHLVDNNTIYTMEDDKLARREIELITVQGDKAIIKNTIPEKTLLVTTILQKPLIGMPVKKGNGNGNGNKTASADVFSSDK